MERGDTRILLVDDKPESLNLLEIHLKLAGYPQIKTATDGQQAIDLAESYQPNIILMDTRMPDLYGYEVCRQIKQETYGEKIAIIGISDNDDSEYRKQWLEADADDFFYKGIIYSNKEDLEVRIQEALRKHQSQS